jgi:hypothetical protein
MALNSGGVIYITFNGHERTFELVSIQNEKSRHDAIIAKLWPIAINVYYYFFLASLRLGESFSFRLKIRLRNLNPVAA